MHIQDSVHQIIEELNEALSDIDAEPVDDLVEAIVTARRIFVAGAGRSGLAIRGFAMRLMHMGFAVHVVGEITSPGLTVDDLLVIGSGSGATDSLLVMAKKAKCIGAPVALITVLARSPIGNQADIVLTIPAPTPKIEGATGFVSAQPMGSLFEQALWLALDALIMVLMSRMEMDAHTMFTRHANIE